MKYTTVGEFTLPNGDKGWVGTIWEGRTGTYNITPIEKMDGPCVFSIYIYSNKKIPIAFSVLGTAKTVNINPGWQRVIIKCLSPNNDAIYIRPLTDDQFYIYKALLEKGNTVTDWKESANDIENNVSYMLSSVSQALNTVKQLADKNEASISSLVKTVESISDENNETVILVESLESRTSLLEQDLSGFKSTVSNTYQTKDDMSGYYTSSQTDSKITQSANSITQNISQTYATKTDVTKVNESVDGIAERIDNTVLEVTMLWYANSSQTKPSKPTSRVTSTSVNGGVWTTAKPKYITSHPYFYYCYQYKKENGTYSWSDVKLDPTENTVNTKISNVVQDLSGFKREASDTYATKGTVTDLANNLETNYSTTQSTSVMVEEKIDGIRQTVSETYATQQSVTNLENNITSNYSTTTQMESAINQKANEITSAVSGMYATKDDVSKVDSEIKQTAESISSKVSNDEIISTINQSAEEVAINANKINLNGVVTANENFKILEDGSMQAVNGLFTGIINSKEGNIGGFEIQGNKLVKKSDPYNYIVIDAENHIFEVASGTGRNNLLDNTLTFANGFGRPWAMQNFGMYNLSNYDNVPSELAGGKCIVSSNSLGSQYACTCKQDLHNNGSYTDVSFNTLVFNNNVYYTFSFYVQCDISDTIRLYSHHSSSGEGYKTIEIHPTEGQWKRYETIVKGGLDGWYELELDGSNPGYSHNDAPFEVQCTKSGIKLAGFKMERGIISTPWCKSLNDTKLYTKETLSQVSNISQAYCYKDRYIDRISYQGKQGNGELQKRGTSNSFKLISNSGNEGDSEMIYFDRYNKPKFEYRRCVDGFQCGSEGEIFYWDDIYKMLKRYA